MATIAVGVAAAATVASTAYSASQSASAGKGGGGSVPQPQTAALWENIFNRDTADILGNERAMYDNAMAASNFMDDNMYRALGYEPIYDEAQDADVAGLSQQYNAINDQMNAVQAKWAALKGQKAAKNAKQAKARGVPTQAGKKKQLKQLKQQETALSRQAEAARQALSQAQTVPRRVVGLKPIQPEVGGAGRDVRGAMQLAQLPDPTSSKDGLYAAALDLELNNLVRALKGEEPADPTLVRTLDEEQRQLENQLARNLGPDYATSTPGIEALANQRKRRAEALATYNREAITTYSNLSTQRATSLSSLRAQRLDQEAYPVKLRLAEIMATNDVVASRIDYLAERRYDRGQNTEAEMNTYTAEQNARAARAAARAQTAQAIAQVGKSVAGGIYGAGTTGA